ncbi:hypothetical protein ACFCW2_03445 [Qipengyuania sp. DSG2-2]|uniref:hypothetical protein n=1 Tax=Qipengyuania sp. DGS2-2 TaxID=3349631 RepID=UPI0036D31AD9
MANNAAVLSRFGPVAISLTLASALSACAVSQPVSIQSIADVEAAAKPSSVFLIVTEKPDSSRRFGEALVSAFGAAGLDRSDDAALVGDYGLALAPASTAITEKPREAAGPSSVRTVAVPVKSSPLDKCAPQRMKATLSLLDRTSGTIRYRGEGTVVDCAFTEADERAMADALVADAMGQMGL